MATKKTTKPKKTAKPAPTTFWGKLRKFIFKSALWFFGISLFLVVLFKFVPVPFTPLMAVRAIENSNEGKGMVCSHDWVPLEDISMNLQKLL